MLLTPEARPAFVLLILQEQLQLHFHVPGICLPGSIAVTLRAEALRPSSSVYLYQSKLFHVLAAVRTLDYVLHPLLQLQSVESFGNSEQFESV